MGRTHKAEGVLNLNPDRSRQILSLGIYTADTQALRNSLSWYPLSLYIHFDLNEAISFKMCAQQQMCVFRSEAFSDTALPIGLRYFSHC